jgi:hypothetical protein
MKSLEHIHPIGRWKKTTLTAKVTIVAITLGLVGLGIFGWNMWQDNKNEQLLLNISADFAALEIALEQELGVEVENKSGCFTTSEKFNEGKTACYARLESTNDKEKGKELLTTTSKSPIFNNVRDFSNSFGYSVTYNTLLCTIAATPNTYGLFAIECPVAVRAGNADLVAELF